MAGLGSSRQSSHLQRCARKGWGKWDSWSGSSQWNKIPIRRRRVPTVTRSTTLKSEEQKWKVAVSGSQSEKSWTNKYSSERAVLLIHQEPIRDKVCFWNKCQALHHSPSCHRRTSDSGTLDRPRNAYSKVSKPYSGHDWLLNPSSR